MINLNTIVLLVRWFTAVILPIGAMFLSYRMLRVTQQAQTEHEMLPQACLTCGQVRAGALAIFAYTKTIESPRRELKKKQPASSTTTSLITETHPICDPCARRYLWHEVLLQMLIVLLYPLYAGVVFIVLKRDAPFSNILLEVFLMLLSFAGVLATLNLHRAISKSDPSSAEIRARAAIQFRRKSLGKDCSYYTSGGMHNLKK